MSDKDTASAMSNQFFTALGLYMAPVPSSGGEKTNWINYKTGQKNIFFRVEIFSNSCQIGILLNDPDATIRLRQYNKLKEFSLFFKQEAGDRWTWNENSIDKDGKMVSRIYDSLEGFSVYNKYDWPMLISFLKPRFIALDAFWGIVKDNFII
jgi:hypothetical protein